MAKKEPTIKLDGDEISYTNPPSHPDRDLDKVNKNAKTLDKMLRKSNGKN